MDASRKAKIKKLFWWISCAGVPLGYLGIVIDSPVLMWMGIAIAAPLFLVVLPLCLLALIAVYVSLITVPIYDWIAKRHGAPFVVGDIVEICRGKETGRRARVYQVWGDRKQVRLDLGKEPERTCDDVYGYLQVRKLKTNEPCAQPSPHFAPESTDH